VPSRAEEGQACSGVVDAVRVMISYNVKCERRGIFLVTCELGPVYG